MQLLQTMRGEVGVVLGLLERRLSNRAPHVRHVNSGAVGCR
jgi:hypothetical protein